MTPEMEALGRRAVACKGWMWMHGMSNSRGEVIDRVDVETGKAYYGEWDADMTALPDLTDAATLGCLLALVRVAWKDAELYAAPVEYGWPDQVSPWWHVWDSSSEQHGPGAATEAEALVAALEDAP